MLLKRHSSQSDKQNWAKTQVWNVTSKRKTWNLQNVKIDNSVIDV
jgi:hypothetical protein